MNIDRVKEIVEEINNQEHGYNEGWTIWDQGRLAYAAGLTLTDCPCIGEDAIGWAHGFQQENYYEKNGEAAFDKMTEEELLAGIEHIVNELKATPNLK